MSRQGKKAVGKQPRSDLIPRRSASRVTGALSWRTVCRIQLELGFFGGQYCRSEPLRAVSTLAISRRPIPKISGGGARLYGHQPDRVGAAGSPSFIGVSPCVRPVRRGGTPSARPVPRSAGPSPKQEKQGWRLFCQPFLAAAPGSAVAGRHGCRPRCRGTSAKSCSAGSAWMSSLSLRIAVVLRFFRECCQSQTLLPSRCRPYHN